MTEFGTPFWWEDGAPLPDLPTTPPGRADIAIVGAGFTGLSAALTAAKAGAKVVVIDATVPGQGASTRNGGMAGSYPRGTIEELTQTYGPSMAVALYDEARDAVEFVEGLLDQHQIDCDYQITGRIQLAWTQKHLAKQVKNTADVAAKSKMSPVMVDRAGMADHIRTDKYFGGVYLANHGGLHPRKFHDGLMRAALDAGITVVQNCPVRQVHRPTGGFRLDTANGEITAEKVILATNGYTRGKGVLNRLRRNVFPLPSYLIATEPLPDKLIERIAPGRRMMVETRARYSYYRLSPDGTRILWGGRASMVQVPPQEAAVKLRNIMVGVWPDLQDVNISHAWKGNTGFSHAMLPHVGKVDGMHIAMGYCGSGVVMAPYLGNKAALQALGLPGGQTVYSQTHLKTSWMQPTRRPHFLHAANQFYDKIVDPMERRAARKDRRKSAKL